MRHLSFRALSAALVFGSIVAPRAASAQDVPPAPPPLPQLLPPLAQPAPQPPPPPPPSGWQPGCAPGQPCPPPPPPPQGWQGPPPPQGWQPPPPQGWPPPPPQGWSPPPSCPPGQICGGAGFPPPAPRPNRDRDLGEMFFLYGTGLAYGVGVGTWIDVLAGVKNPGVAMIAPIAFGAAVPVGFGLWDNFDTFRRGVPSSTATGMLFGALEGVAIASTQAVTVGPQKRWTPETNATLTFLLSTGGGVGGYFFGRWLEPNPKSMVFLSSTTGWGALSGLAMGTGFVVRDTQVCPPGQLCPPAALENPAIENQGWKDGAAIGSLIGLNAGFLGGGALLAAGYDPSLAAQKWMWLGFGLGAAITTPVYFFYIDSKEEPRHALVAQGMGALAGLAVAAIFTRNMSDDEPRLPPGARAKHWTPPFQISGGPTQGGAMLTAMGQW